MDLARAPRRTARKKGSGYENGLSGNIQSQPVTSHALNVSNHITTQPRIQALSGESHAQLIYLILVRFSDQPTDLEEGAQHLVRYSVISSLLENGAVALT